MRVFMTGATGEIGRRAVPLMIAAGHRVRPSHDLLTTASSSAASLVLRLSRPICSTARACDAPWSGTTPWSTWPPTRRSRQRCVRFARSPRDRR